MTRKAIHRSVDLVLAVGLAVIAVMELWLPLDSAQGEGPRGLSTFVGVGLCLALADRRGRPLFTALVVLLTWPIVFTLQPVYVLFWGQFVPMVLATYSVARYSTRRGALVGAAAAAACLLYFDFFVPGMGEVNEVLFHWLVLTSAWVIGTVVRLAEERARASTKLAIETELASRTRTIRAISEERARIARELHDIVAHAVSIMVVQAGAAEQVVDNDPTLTRASLKVIRSTGANALTEMRRVVDMLRDEHDHEELGPQPGVASLPALIEQSTNDSLAVRLVTQGDPRELPAGLDLTVYRIVQEALTNVRRHSGASTADVTLQFLENALRISVVDDGTGGSEVREGGNGVIGMRERATIFGGSLDIECDGSSGFTVRATLPLESR